MLRTVFKTVTIVTSLLLAADVSAAQMEWLEDGGPWRVGWTANGEKSHCQVEWKSDQRSITFRVKGEDKPGELILQKSTWNIPKGQTTTVELSPLPNPVPMMQHDSSSLSAKAKGDQALIANVALTTLLVMPVTIKFSGKEPAWFVPALAGDVLDQAVRKCTSVPLPQDTQPF